MTIIENIGRLETEAASLREKFAGLESAHEKLELQRDSLKRELVNKRFEQQRTGKASVHDKLERKCMDLMTARIPAKEREIQTSLAALNDLDEVLSPLEAEIKRLKTTVAEQVTAFVRRLIDVVEMNRLHLKDERKRRNFETEKATRSERKAAHKMRLRADREAKAERKAAVAGKLERERKARAAQQAAKDQATKNKAERKKGR